VNFLDGFPWWHCIPRRLTNSSSRVPTLRFPRRGTLRDPHSRNLTPNLFSSHPDCERHHKTSSPTDATMFPDEGKNKAQVCPSPETDLEAAQARLPVAL
jgi:hypothetical protein